MEDKKLFSLETSGVLSYYIYNKLQNSKKFVEKTENENNDLPAIKEATLREDGVVSVDSVKRMAEIIAEQAKMYAAAVRSGLRTPILVEEVEEPQTTDTFELNSTEIEDSEVVGEELQPDEPIDDQVGMFDGTEKDVFDQPVSTEDIISDTEDDFESNVEIDTDDLSDDTMPEIEVRHGVLVGQESTADIDEDLSQKDFTDEGNKDVEDAPVLTGLTVRKSTKSANETADTEPIAVEEEGEEWECPYCHAKVKGFFCPDCGTSKPEEEEDTPILNIASNNANKDKKDSPVMFTGLPTDDEAEENVAQPAMEAVEELHKVDSTDEDETNEYASIADFLKSL